MVRQQRSQAGTSRRGKPSKKPQEKEVLRGTLLQCRSFPNHLQPHLITPGGGFCSEVAARAARSPGERLFGLKAAARAPCEREPGREPGALRSSGGAEGKWQSNYSSWSPARVS